MRSDKEKEYQIYESGCIKNRRKRLIEGYELRETNRMCVLAREEDGDAPEASSNMVSWRLSQE